MGVTSVGFQKEMLEWYNKAMEILFDTPKNIVNSNII